MFQVRLRRGDRGGESAPLNIQARDIEGGDDKLKRKLFVYNTSAFTLHVLLAIIFLGVVVSKGNQDGNYSFYRLNITSVDGQWPDVNVVPLERNEYGLNPFAAILYVEIVTFLAHGFYIYNLRKKNYQNTFYWKGVVEQVHLFRWIEYALSAPVMGCIVAFFCGLRLLTSFMLVYSQYVGLMMIGYWVERELRLLKLKKKEQPITAPIPAIIAFCVGMILFIIVGAAQFLLFHEAEQDNDKDMPSWIVVVVIGLFFLFFCFSIPLLMRIYYIWKGKENNDDISPNRGELSYIVLSFTAKAFLAIMFVSNALT